MSLSLPQLVIIPSLKGALAISILLLARSVWRIVFGARGGWVEGLSIALLVGVASFIAIDLMQESRFATSGELLIFTDFLCLLFFFTIVTYAFHCSAFSGVPSILRRNTHSWMMIVISLVMTGWFSHRIEIRSRDYSLIGLELLLPGAVEVDSKSFAMTDQGTIVALYKVNVTDSRFEEYIKESRKKFKDFDHVGIRRDHADRMTNCHGWVFTGGKFLLKGQDVDRILCDNSYFMVKSPQPDDLIIYRDKNGQIQHTALVQAVLHDGTVISESKWGIDQRFIHRPEDQPYSPNFEYFRTLRPNHLIEILDSDSIDVDLNGG
jgi:hypothetical protein